MEVSSSFATHSGAEIVSSKRPVESTQPKDGPFGAAAPEPQDRGAAVVFGGSLANSDRSSKSRDAERQSKVEDKPRDAASRQASHDRSEATRQRADEERAKETARREESAARRDARRDASHEVDVSA